MSKLHIEEPSRRAAHQSKDHNVGEKPGRDDRNLEKNVSRIKGMTTKIWTSHLTEWLKLRILKKKKPLRIPNAFKEHELSHTLPVGCIQPLWKTLWYFLIDLP